MLSNGPSHLRSGRGVLEDIFDVSVAKNCDVASRQQLVLKTEYQALAPLLVKMMPPTIVCVRHLGCNPAQSETIMNPRLAAMTALRREVAIPASVLAWIAAFGSVGLDNTGAAPIVDLLAPSLAADSNFADKLPPIALGSAGVL